MLALSCIPQLDNGLGLRHTAHHWRLATMSAKMSVVILVIDNVGQNVGCHFGD